MTSWQREMTAAIGREVNRLRGDRSHLWLQNRTEELGFRVARSSLSQLETGKRNSISVAELLVLSAALEVPPLLLLWPGYPDGSVEHLPTQEASAFSAVLWMDGRSQVIDGEDGLFMLHSPNALVGAVEERHRLARMSGEGLVLAFDRFQKWTESPDSGESDQRVFESVMESVDEMRQKIRTLEREIVKLGGTVIDGEG